MRIKSSKKILIKKLSYNFFTFDKFQFSVVNYNILSSLFIYNKTRRLMVARTKRILKKRGVASKVWVKLGKIVFLFKKALNSRMGKGTGSFFSVRRWLNTGSRILSFFSKRSGFTKLVLKYIKARLQVPVSFFVRHSKSVFKFRNLPTKFKRFKRLKLRKNKKYYSVYDYKFTRKKRFLLKLTYILWKEKYRLHFGDDDDYGMAYWKRSKKWYILRTWKIWNKFNIAKKTQSSRKKKTLFWRYVIRNYYLKKFNHELIC